MEKNEICTNAKNNNNNNKKYAEKGTLYGYMVWFFVTEFPFCETGIIAHSKWKSTEIYPSAVFRFRYVHPWHWLNNIHSTHDTPSESIGNSLSGVCNMCECVSVSVCLGSFMCCSILHWFSISRSLDDTSNSLKSANKRWWFELLQLLFQDLYDLHIAFFCYCYCFVDFSSFLLRNSFIHSI